MSSVYFLKIENPANSYEEIGQKIYKLLEASGLSSILGKNKLTAVKIHFGEKGNEAYLKPPLVKKIISKIKEYNASPFLTDSNTLYKGSRTNTYDHIKTAYEHGFTFENVGAPIIIADGFNGQDFVNIEVNQKHFKDIKIGACAFHAHSLVAVTHFKGHELTGFGGAIKNISMGLASRGGKQTMHSEVLPKITASLCNGCMLCMRWCPEEAIEIIEKDSSANEKESSKKLINCDFLRDLSKSSRCEAVENRTAGVLNRYAEERKRKTNEARLPDGQADGLFQRSQKFAQIIPEKCIGCGECVVTCPINAIAISWRGSPLSVQEKMAEYAFGAIKNKNGKCYFLNFLIDISPNCDCYAFNDEPIVKDIGVLASLDPIAIDQASFDLVNDYAGKNIFKKIYPEIDGTIQLSYGEKIGLGARVYKLINI